MIVTMPAELTREAPHRARYDAVVEANTLICREHYRLRLRIDKPFPQTEPGQFIQLGCRPPAEALPQGEAMAHEWQPGERPTLVQPELCSPLALLRRPFSLAGRGDDGDGTWIEVIHRVVGTGTGWLESRQAGDKVDFIGPLGNAFTLPEGKSMGLMVGGGVGLPPMFYLAQRLKAAGWDGIGYVGALSRDLLAVSWVEGATPNVVGDPQLCVSEWQRLGFPAVVTTDDGTFGLKGRITTGLERTLSGMSRADLDRTVIFTCGPEPMMHAVYQLAQRFGVDVQACLEQAMACGMGTCQSCIVKIENHDSPQATTPDGRPWRFKLACTDGPVFAGQDVVWQ